MQRITPFLWFDNQAEEAVRFYTAIFDGAPGQSANYDAASAEVSGQPEGSVMTVAFTRTSRSSGPGTGSGTSWYVRTSGPPGAVITIAFMRRSFRLPAGIRHHR